MEELNSILTEVSGFLWGWPMIILLLGTHIYLTICLRFPQRYILKAIKLSVLKDPAATGDVSQFGSLATALAATIGTGNIIGVATAIALGGPGAVLWCWLTGVFGISTSHRLRRSWCRTLVLAYRCVRYLHEIRRRTVGY